MISADVWADISTEISADTSADVSEDIAVDISADILHMHLLNYGVPRYRYVRSVRRS